MSLEQYKSPVAMSNAGRHAALLNELPRGPVALSEIVQGLLIHQHIAPAYGISLNLEEESQSHIRPVEMMLDAIVTRGGQLRTARPIKERQVGVCRHFTLLHVTMLRMQGIPARARCGFAAYFEKGKFLDHWVTEYWIEEQKCWALFDSQIDARQRDLFDIQMHTSNVPRDQFLVAGDAWKLCRDGICDPEAFGVMQMHGLWFIAGNLIRDIAALNNCEMLPWDVWGGMPKPNSEFGLAFFDHLAIVSRDPETHAKEVKALFRDQRVKVPTTVFNAVLNVIQTVLV